MAKSMKWCACGQEIEVQQKKSGAVVFRVDGAKVGYCPRCGERLASDSLLSVAPREIIRRFQMSLVWLDQAAGFIKQTRDLLNRATGVTYGDA